MKGRRVLRRRRAEGFTLLELMVVVMLIAILAVIAAPSMVVARNDQLAFNYARRTSELFHNARARSAGRGAAHLVLFTTESSFGGTRGAVFVFEALDGSSPPTGPNPASRCRSTTQWVDVAAYTPGAADTNLVHLVDWLNVNTSQENAIQVLEDIKMVAHQVDLSTESAVPHVPGDPITALVICTTPNGTTHVGTGNSASAAINDMLISTARNTYEIDVMRHRASNPVGLIRRVILAGSAAPRIKSE